MILDLAAVLSLALIGLTLVIVLWNVTAWPRITKAADERPGQVSVLIPARNEAGNIAACLQTALDQGPVVAEVLVCDDRSSDATADIVRGAARSDRRVRLLPGVPLPDGWCGKNLACARLAREAGAEWLLFLDADARLESRAAARMLSEASQRAATMISAWPRLVMQSLWERMLMPMLNVVAFSLFPAPLALVRDDPSLALAHGACILVNRRAYERVGGHTAVRGEIFEDSRLAALWRATGERAVCLDGSAVVSVRMYHRLPDIWRGFRKNFYPAFRAPASFWAFLALHLCVFAMPLVLPFFEWSWPAAAALAGLVAIRLLLAARFRHPFWSVAAHPIAEAVLVGIALSSWWRCRTGRGVEWKGRTYLSGGGRQEPAG